MSRFDYWVLVQQPGTIFSMHELSVGEWHGNLPREGNSPYHDDGRFSQPYVYDVNSAIGINDIFLGQASDYNEWAETT
jgi:hypothetical protein